MKGKPAMDTQEVKNPETMTDREIAVETLVLLRFFAEAMQAIGKSPMMAAMMPGFPVGK